jgi:hypothetical protein
VLCGPRFLYCSGLLGAPLSLCLSSWLLPCTRVWLLAFLCVSESRENAYGFPLPLGARARRFRGGGKLAKGTSRSTDAPWAFLAQGALPHSACLRKAERKRSQAAQRNWGQGRAAPIRRAHGRGCLGCTKTQNRPGVALIYSLVNPRMRVCTNWRLRPRTFWHTGLISRAGECVKASAVRNADALSCSRIRLAPAV